MGSQAPIAAGVLEMVGGNVAAAVDILLSVPGEGGGGEEEEEEEVE